MSSSSSAPSVSPARARVCALTIAGLDPGGGAGVLADLRAFHAAGVFGCAAVALLTVQSTSGVKSVRALPSSEVVEAAREVLRVQRVRAVKIGALGSASNVRAVARLLREPAHALLPVVLDTVLSPTRGASPLLAARGLHALTRHLLPRASLVTANAIEAAALTGLRVESLSDARAAALALVEMGARAALVKGGHLRVSVRRGAYNRDAAESVTDVLALGHSSKDLMDISAARLPLGPMASRIHGGGCALASLIAGRLAHEAARTRTISNGVSASDISAAVRWAKKAHHTALSSVVDVGGDMRVLVFEDDTSSGSEC